MSEKVYEAVCIALRRAIGYDHYRDVVAVKVNGKLVRMLVTVVKANNKYVVSVAQYDSI